MALRKKASIALFIALCIHPHPTCPILHLLPNRQDVHVFLLEAMLSCGSLKNTTYKMSCGCLTASFGLRHSLEAASHSSPWAVCLWNLEGLTVLNGLMPINKLVVSISLLSSTWQWMVTLEMGGKDRPPANYNKEVTRSQWSSTSQGMEGLELHKSLRESH